MLGTGTELVLYATPYMGSIVLVPCRTIAIHTTYMHALHYSYSMNSMMYDAAHQALTTQTPTLTLTINC